MYDNEIILKDAFINWNNEGGIIKNLTDNFDVPWKNDIDGSILDLEYYGNHSGDKLISPLVVNLLGDNGYVETSNILKLSNLLYVKYGLNWNKLWDTLNFEYNPIENYNMTETEEITGTDEETIDETQGGTDTRRNTGTDTTTINNEIEREDGGSDTVSETGTRTTENSVYAFNSSNASPDSKTIETPNIENETEYGKTESETETGTNTKTLNLQDAITYGKTDNIEKEGNKTENRELTRSGNIGVTTSQQMIESERKLWDWNFFERIFDDIDTVLTIPAYGL